MIGDSPWSAPLVKQLNLMIDNLIARHGKGSSVSLGDIWPALAKRYPEGSPIDLKCPKFKRFLKCRIIDQLRSERRRSQPSGYRFLSNFDRVKPLARHHEPSDELIRAEQEARVWTLFDRLPKGDQDLLLAQFNKRSSKPAELARSQNLSTRTIKRRQHDAWIRLLGMLNLIEPIGGDS